MCIVQEHKHAVYDPGHTHASGSSISPSVVQHNQRMISSSDGFVTYLDLASGSTSNSFSIESSQSHLVVSAVTVAEAGQETRPKNMAVVWIMRII